MIPLPPNQLKDYINKKLLMESENWGVQEVMIKKITGNVIYGYNKTKKCLFEITDSSRTKFYISK